MDELFNKYALEEYETALLNFVRFFDTPQFRLQFKKDFLFNAMLEQARQLVTPIDA